VIGPPILGLGSGLNFGRTRAGACLASLRPAFSYHSVYEYHAPSPEWIDAGFAACVRKGPPACGRNPWRVALHDQGDRFMAFQRRGPLTTPLLVRQWHAQPWRCCGPLQTDEGVRPGCAAFGTGFSNPDRSAPCAIWAQDRRDFVAHSMAEVDAERLLSSNCSSTHFGLRKSGFCNAMLPT